MTYTGQTSLAVKPSFSDRAEEWSRLLREVLMFGPGTFFLFYLTLTNAFFYPSLGFSFQGALMYLFAIFLTYAGAGSITRVKNFAVPATVIMLALLLVLFSYMFPGRELVDLYFWDSIYFFPFVLVLAKLVQNWMTVRD